MITGSKFGQLNTLAKGGATCPVYAVCTKPKFDTVVLDGKHAAAWDKAMTDIDAETRRIIESIKD